VLDKRAIAWRGLFLKDIEKNAERLGLA